ncbi:ATP-binding protein [Streptantibioticus parmotrematis]|uniref:ATP-binding protein n=1 Tax=Streptantibioticus parmotrematis TaxID=2873249 RepID=UPI0033D61D0D
MRLPVRHIAGNVIWSTTGSCWGIWRVEGASSAHASLATKKRRLATIEALVKSLSGEAMLLSLCPQIDPASVVETMTAGVDLEHPGSERYVELSLRVLDQLDCLELTGRTDWLAVPLPVTRGQALRQAVAAARSDVTVQLGLIPAPVPAQEEVAQLEAAQRMAAAWPSGLRLRPAREAEILWMYAHAARRGVPVEPLLPSAGAPCEVLGRGRSVAALGEVVLAEGARPAADGDGDGGRDGARQRRGAGGRAGFGRRWLRVSTEWGDSYQALLALSEMPRAFRWPGSELLASLDEHGMPVDWVVRLKVTPGRIAEAKSRRQARELAAQPEQYGADPAGVPDSVDEDTEDLREYRAKLTASQTEVEASVMTAMCVWGTTPEEAVARAEQLAQHYQGSEYTLTRPVGRQEDLWYGMLPGARTPKVMTGYRQILLGRDFAMSGPFASTALGDEHGPLYGLQLSGGGLRPVFVDWTRGPDQAASASAAFIGEVGGGKSTALKAAVYSILAAGHRVGQPASRGRAVIVDRTPQQEWVRFARACPGTTQVVGVDRHAAVSLDPLRAFTSPEEAQRFTESFLTLLLGINPMDEQGIALSEAIEEVLAGPAPSMRALVEELTARGPEDPMAQSLARKLASHQRKDLSRAIFDPALPVVDTAAADAIVFAVSNLALPKKAELEGARLDRMEYEKVFGRAALYLIAAISRKVCFENPAEYCAAVWDECWWLTSSPEGLELLLELVRDGRKHNAGVLAASHDADDIGPEASEQGRVVRGLFRRRFLFRQSDDELARRGLKFMGLPPNDEDLVTRVTTGLSPLMEDGEAQALRAGECLHRDLLGRIGGMQVLIPADPDVAAAIHSDPALAA